MMLALTLKHPWVWAILHAGKRVENRKWGLPPEYLNRWILLHGGKSPLGPARWEALRDYHSICNHQIITPSRLDATILPGIRGAFKVSEVINKASAHPMVESPWFHGPRGWVLSEVVRFPEAVDCRGNQGLWHVPATVAAEVERLYGGLLK
jgi:hypothetical protein